jgi:zona occludens toxin
MITLLTGTPGAGKTAWLVNHLFIEGVEEYGQRPLFVHGIPALTVPHEVIKCRSPLCRVCEAVQGEHPYADEWHQWAPDGSLIVLDEVQNVFRPRSSASSVPPAVARLETHRHQGIDFFIVSQGPQLFDVNVRRLIGRHIHLRATSLGRYQYEWPECNDLSSFSGTDKRPYKLPKRAFSLYKSAEIHTKHDRRKPIAFYVVIAALLFLVPLVYKVYGRIDAVIHPESVMVQKTIPQVQQNGLAHVTPSPPSPAVSNQFDFHPRQPGRPETAPAYDGMVEVVTAPIVIGCASGPGWCRCYATKGYPYPATEQFCRDYLAGKVLSYLRAKPLYSAQTHQSDDSSRISQMITSNIGRNDYFPASKLNEIKNQKVAR